MVLLKILGIVSAIFLVLLVALFVKKQYTITREMIVGNSVGGVYSFVRFHKNQKYDNHWSSLDPDTTIKINGDRDGQVGSIPYFESHNRKVGAGEWDDATLIDNEQMKLELRLLSPYQFTASARFNFEPADGKRIQLIWEYKSGMNWPNVTVLFMDMDKIGGNDIEATLIKIKSNTEK